MTEAILFDFDGTLADTQAGILRTMEETFRAMQLPVPSAEAMRATIGIPLFDALKSLNNLSDRDGAQATDLYGQLFPRFEATLVTLFPGVLETLDALQSCGLRLAICTSRNAESLELIMEHHGLSPYFEQCVTASDALPPKPSPAPAQALLARMGLRPQEAFVVGDTTYDIEMGRRASCPTVAVTYGNHPLRRLLTASPTFVIPRFPDLADLV